MKKYKLVHRIVAFTIFFLILSSLHLINPSRSYAASDLQKVYDTADLLTDEEKSEIEDLCNTYGKELGTDIIIVTTDTTGGLSRQTFLEDFYDEYVYNYSNYEGNAALLLINMENGNRGFEIQGYGDGNESTQYYLNGDRIDSMISEIKPLLSDGDYYNAMNEYVNLVYNYVGTEYPSPIYYQLWFQVLIALGIGAIAVGIMAYNSGGRVTVDEGTYMDHSHSRILAKSDEYIRTTVTRTKKPENNSSGGGGGSGRSSGGHSHSGGGSSF